MKTNPLNQQTVTMDEAQKSNPILPSIAPKNGKRKSVLAMAAFLLVIMSGCLVKSLHPFYTDKDIVYDPITLDRNDPELIGMVKRAMELFPGDLELDTLDIVIRAKMVW